MYTISGIYIYPIKSLGGISLASAQVGRRGFEYDRRWMIVDENGVFMTQRQYPQMALLKVSMQVDSLIIQHSLQGWEQLRVPIQSSYTGEELPVIIWDDVCMAERVSDQVDSWLSKVLGKRASLVYMPSAFERRVEPERIKEHKIVGFADSYPFLIIGEATLEQLNRKLAEPVLMNRFRPNLVFSGGSPHDEDRWHQFSMHEMQFTCAKACSRCSVTTVDQESGQKGAEPLRTLGTYRRVGSKIMFGQNLVHEGEGEIKVGDRLSIMSWKPSPQ